MTVNVVCMKWGSAYPAYYVNRLFWMVKKNLNRKFRFVCITDDPSGIVKEVECVKLPALKMAEPYASYPWKKLLLFSKNLGNLKGKTLFLDLDLVIVDNIDCFFDYPKGLYIIRDWGQRETDCVVGNSSVFLFEFGAYPQILEYFKKNMVEVFAKYRNEQTYLSKVVNDMKFWPEDWVKSFKNHCFISKQLRGVHSLFAEPKIPKGAKIIAFHGRPKPGDVIEGKSFMGMKLTKGAPWVKKHWCVEGSAASDVGN